MHVPYSMDDSEPDLYGSLGGQQDLYSDDQQDLYSSYGGREGFPAPEPVQRQLDLQPLLSFASEEELVLSEVFQRHLKKSLAFKQRQIDELRQEYMDSLDRPLSVLREDYITALFSKKK